MNDEKLLDQYIDENYSNLKPWIADEERKYISKTLGFSLYRANREWEEMIASFKTELDKAVAKI